METEDIIDRYTKLSFLLGFAYGGLNEIYKEIKEECSLKNDIKELITKLERGIDEAFYKGK